MKLKGINIIKGTKKKEKKNVYGKTVRATCPTASCVSYQVIKCVFLFLKGSKLSSWDLKTFE